jgi:hypothetical protein
MAKRLSKQTARRAIQSAARARLSQDFQTQWAAFVAGSTLSGQQMEAVQSAMMDSPAEIASHQRTMMELKAIFEEPLKRLDAISQEEWDAAE